jgi:hypothetical protein
MEASINVNTIESVVHYAVLAIAFAACLFLRPEISRRAARFLFVCWLAIWSAEFWMFGPAAFIHYFDEANQSFPLLVYTADILKGTFAHGHAGGIDAATMPWYAAQISFERFVFQLFPPWIAMLVHKLLVAGTAMIGAYMLLRRLCGADRWLALVLAAVYTVSHRYVALVTLAEGIAFAGTPLLAYLIVFRARVAGTTTIKNYFVAVAGFALIYAISSMPVHAALVSVSTLAAMIVLVGGIRWGRVAGAGGLLFIAVLANWFVYLYALVVYSPETARLEEVDFTLPVDAFLSNLWQYIPDETQISSLVLAALGLVFMLFSREDRPLLPRYIGALVIVLLSGPVLAAVPWKDFGLPHLSAIQFRYMSYATPLIALMVLGQGLVAVHRYLTRMEPGKWQGCAVAAPAALGLALALAQLSANKAANLSYWSGLGSQRAMLGLEGLRDAKWHPREPFRVSAVPLRLPPSFLATYGLEAFDGYPQIPSRHWVYYWLKGIGMPPRFLYATVAEAGHGKRSDFWRCCESHDITKQIDVDLLRVANVTHLVSIVPLHGGDIKEVAGPPPADRPLIVTANTPMREKMKNYFSRNFAPGRPYVYSLPAALPRAFFATSHFLSRHRPTESEFYREVASYAPERRVVTHDPAFPAAAAKDSATIETLSRQPDGYTLAVNAPEGGILVLNHSQSRFWQVEADGKALKIWPVNGIHMAIVLPPGVRRVTALYRSPRPW